MATTNTVLLFKYDLVNQTQENNKDGVSWMQHELD